MAIVLITGGHSGIGLACSKRLASTTEHTLLLAGRDLERLEGAASQLRSQGAAVETLELDVASLASVRAGAARCRALLDGGESQGLQAILCNAGAQFMGPVSYSPEGYGMTFATNYLGHFLLIDLLINRVMERGRVVFTASGTHDPDTVDGKMVGRAVDPDATALANAGRNGSKSPSTGVRYATSKLCDLLCAYELDRRLRRADSSVASIAFDPGPVAGTGLLRTHPKPIRWRLRRRSRRRSGRR